jgi:hypothetical protein
MDIAALDPSYDLLAAQNALVACAYPLLKSGSSRTWPQPSHDHVVRRLAAAWQAVSLDRGTCKSPCLPAGLPFLTRQRHPLANDGAPHLFGHLDFLSSSRRNPPWSKDTRVVQPFRSLGGATPPSGSDRSAIVAPEARNRIRARYRARQRSRVLPLRCEGFRSLPASGRQPKPPTQRQG